jgi:hypothetical protein
MGGRARVVVGVALSAAVLTVYLGVIALIFAVQFGVNTSLPWWIGVAAPVALYAVLVPFSLSLASAGVQLGVLGVLGVGYAVLAAITAAVVAAVTGLDFVSALGQSSLRFLPAPLLQLFVLPMSLLPLRSLVEAPRHPQRRRSDRQPGNWDRRREAVPGWDHRAGLAGQMPGESPDVEDAPEVDDVVEAPVPTTRAVEPALAAREPVAVPVVAQRRARDVEAPVAAPVVDAAAPAVHAAAAVHAAVDVREEVPASVADRIGAVSTVTASEPAPVPSEPAVRTEEPTPAPAPATVKTIAISFARVAETLPADFFALPHHVLGAQLSEPGKLVVPVDVVVPQLAEGLVSVSWNDVAAQFPREALGPNAAAMMERLSEGRLMLPLDEIVRALPPELFALSTPTVDLADIESFPLPFQPRDGNGAAAEPPPTAVAVTPAPTPEPVVAKAPPVVAPEPMKVMEPVVAKAPPVVAPEPMKVMEPVVAEAPPGVAPEPVKVMEPVAAEAPPEVAPEPVKVVEPVLAETAPVVALEPVKVTEPIVTEVSPLVALEPVKVPEPVKVTELIVAEEPPLVVPEPVKLPAPIVAEVLPVIVPETVSFVAEAPPVVAPEPVKMPAPIVSAMPPVVAPEPVKVVERLVPEMPLTRVADPVVDGAPEPVHTNGLAPGAPRAASVDVPADGRLESLAVALSPLGTLIASMEEHEGRRLYVFRPPLLTRSDVMEAASATLGFLGQASAHVEQLTVRFAAGAVTLTPIADDPAGPTLVVASAQGDGSLAQLEIASLRECGRKDRKPPLPFTSDIGQELTPVPGGPAADLIAGTIGAFGAFTPSVLRDPERRVELCLLTASGDDARTFGPIAHAACRALEGGPAGGFQSAMLRIGPRRLAVRPVAGRPGHWIALVTTGQSTARPGRVELEMTRAASRVGAR